MPDRAAVVFDVLLAALDADVSQLECTNGMSIEELAYLAGALASVAVAFGRMAVGDDATLREALRHGGALAQLVAL
ncbi:MAG: hypothetical protein ACRDRR_08530 [Pseudonocardiaceae bacterium]